MPKLDKYREYHFEATTKVSENTRTLAVSAIAVIWLFKVKSAGAYQIPHELQLPLILVVCALSLDFLQQLYRSIAWHIFFRRKERDLTQGKITEESEIYADSSINWISYTFFYLKTITIVAAYYLLLQYLLKTIAWT